MSSVTSISKKQAKSGKVSHADPVTIHETSKTKIVLKPFFIPRSAGEELSVKIIRYQREDLGWREVESEDIAISLNSDAVLKALEALRNFAQVMTEEDGDYIVVKVSEGTAAIGNHSPLIIANALTQVLSQSEIISHLQDAEISIELSNALKGSIKLKEMRSAVNELRAMLDGGVVDEAPYHEWCEKHSWAFGNAYIHSDQVQAIAVGDKVDLLLASVISGYRDIIELKRPDKKVLNWDAGHKCYYFSAEVSQAMGQCHRYLDQLSEKAAKGLDDHPEIVAYHPRATIVIGRSNDWTNGHQRTLHGLNSRMPEINVITYDHLLAQAERLLDVLNDSMGIKNQVKVDDDIPF